MMGKEEGSRRNKNESGMFTVKGRRRGRSMEGQRREKGGAGSAVQTVSGPRLKTGSVWRSSSQWKLRIHTLQGGLLGSAEPQPSKSTSSTRPRQVTPSNAPRREEQRVRSRLQARVCANREFWEMMRRRLLECAEMNPGLVTGLLLRRWGVRRRWTAWVSPGTGRTVRCHCGRLPPPTGAQRHGGSARTWPDRERSRWLRPPYHGWPARGRPL